MQTFFVLIYLIVCLALIVVTVLQSGKNSGLSGVLGGGGGDTFLTKNKSKTLDARLSRATKWIAGIFVVLAVVLNLI